MLKTLEVGMHFNPAGGGADRYFDGLLRGFEANGVAFTAAAFGPEPPKKALNQRRISLGKITDSLPKRLFSIYRLGKSLSPDLIATHFALYAFPLLPIFRKHPHIVHFHGPWADESNREAENTWAVRAKRFIESRVYHSAARLIVLSSAFRDILIERYQIHSDKICVIPGGVDIDHFRITGPRAEARRQLGWPVDGKLIFCVRRLVRRMGIENLIRAFALIQQEHPDVTLIIGGCGPLQTELHAQIHEAALEKNVILVGFIPDDQLPISYTAADFSIVPSQSLEGFGLTTLESLACGTPVLVTPVGGLPETVQKLDPTLILSGKDEAALIAGLKRGLRQPLPSSEECRDYAISHYSWRQISLQIAKTYEEVHHDFIR